MEQWLLWIVGMGLELQKNSSWEWGICKKSGLKHTHSVSNTQKLMYSNLESPLLGLAVWITVDSKNNTKNRRCKIWKKFSKNCIDVRSVHDHYSPTIMLHWGNGGKGWRVGSSYQELCTFMHFLLIHIPHICNFLHRQNFVLNFSPRKSAWIARKHISR